MEGTFAGTDSWFRNPASEVSAHFGVAKTGEIRQWVDTANTAWAEVDGNPIAVSCEFEGESGQSLTAAQIDAAAGLAAWCSQAHGIPLVSTNDPNTGGSGLGWHGMGGVPWGDHPDCPGVPVQQQRGAILKAAERKLGPVLTHHTTAGEMSLKQFAAQVGSPPATILRVTVNQSKNREFVTNVADYVNGCDLTKTMPKGLVLYYYLPKD